MKTIKGFNHAIITGKTDQVNHTDNVAVAQIKGDNAHNQKLTLFGFTFHLYVSIVYNTHDEKWINKTINIKYFIFFI